MGYQLLSKQYYKNLQEYEQLYTDRFRSESTLHFRFKIHNSPAFCCLCPEIYRLSSEISSLDKKVYVLAAKLPGAAIEQFTTRCLIDEIILTNDIEGVYSTRKEINNVLRSNGKKKKRFYGLVTKYKMLNISKIPLENCSDIRSIYDELVLPEVIQDDPDNAPDGTIFRKDPAEVTTSTQKIIHQGMYPEQKIIDYMEQALEMLHDESLPDLIRISVFHYLFGYIHPFYDGNGRTSRFISSYLLAQDFEPLIGYRLSYTIKENISSYYDAFKVCNEETNRGDITPFVITFLRIIERSFENLYEALYKRAKRLDELKEKLLAIEELATVYDLCYILLQGSLFSKIGIPKQELCETLHISNTTLEKRLKFVDETGYLKTNKSGHTKFYCFDIERIK